MDNTDDLITGLGFDMGTYFTALAFLIPIVIVASNWFFEYTGLKSRKRKREEANDSFEKVVDNLSADNAASQLSAAVLLRRFMSLKIGGDFFLRKETISVISALLRTLPTGVYQKTLADGLPYASDLDKADLQQTNLQNVYFGSKSSTVSINGTDFFMANLSDGLLDNLDGLKPVFYKAILRNTKIKNSNLTQAQFDEADLKDVTFEKVILKGATFRKALNIPDAISSELVNGVYPLEDPLTTKNESDRKLIFFSMPGVMSKQDEVLVLAYRSHLKDLGYDVDFYTRDTYPRFGQLSRVKVSIEKSAAIVAFGTRQTFIKEGTYRPGMYDEAAIDNSWRSTPWNDVEVGMAAMAGLPVLLVKDDGISDGIFDDILSESFMFSVSSTVDIKDLDKNENFVAWRARIK